LKILQYFCFANLKFFIELKGQIGNPNREASLVLEKNQPKKREATTEVTAGGASIVPYVSIFVIGLEYFEV
jgi:hypothetical protein